MCPVRPAEVARTAVPTVIMTDRPCISCGYNLKGLKNSGKCPECGFPIRTRKSLPRFYDQLINAPMEWIERFALGSFLLAASATAMIAASACWTFRPHWIVGALAAAAGLAWCAGVFLTTQRRPVTLATVIDPQIEWRWMRLGAHVTQAFWPLGLALMTVGWRAITTVGFMPQFLIQLGGVTTLVSIVGLIPLCWYLSNVAFWAADYSLGQKMRVCAWTAWFAALLAVANVLNLRTGSFAGVVGTIIVVARALVILTPAAYLLYCLWSLKNLSAWAVLNHIQADMKTMRLREQAKAILDKPDPAKVKPNAKPSAKQVPKPVQRPAKRGGTNT